jgi:hypothetical protein
MKLVTARKHEFGGDIKKSKKFLIDPEDIGLAADFFTQYRDVISSIVREITTNCNDSRKEMWDYRRGSIEELRSWYESLADVSDEGIQQLKDYFQKKQDRPVEVRLEGMHEIDSHPQIVFQDWGVGISPNRAENVYSNFFASTKRLTNTQMGAFGLGAKAPLGYCDMFTLDTVFNGKKYEYLIRKTEKAPDFDVYDVTDSDEENNTKITVPIEREDIADFRKAISQQLAYFSDIKFVNCGLTDEYEIFRGENFIYRTFTPFHEMHIVLGQVYYPISWYNVNVSEGRECPIGLYFNMNEVENLSILKTREDLEYGDADTRQAINDKYELAKEELQDLVNSVHKPFTDLEAYLRAIDNREWSVEIYPGVTIPKLDKIAQIEEVSLDGYPHLNRIPKDPFPYFYHVKAKIGQHGKKKGGSRDLQLKRYVLGEGTWVKTYFTCSPKTTLTAQKNKYLGRNGDVLLIEPLFKDSKSVREDRMLQHAFGIAHEVDVNSQMTDDQLADTARFATQLSKLLNSRLDSYEDQKVENWWIEEQKELRQRVKKKKEGNITVKRIQYLSDYYARRADESLKWRMDTWDINNFIHTGRHNRLVIYGHQSDEEMLRLAAIIAFRQYQLVSGNWLKVSRIDIIKIAVNSTYVMEMMPNAVHVSSFLGLKKNAAVIRRTMTAYKLKKVMGDRLVGLLHNNLQVTNPEFHEMIHKLKSYIDSNTYEPSRYLGIPDELETFFDQYEKDRKKLIARAKKFKKPMPHMEPAYDYVMIDLAMEVSAYLDKYSLLPWLNFDVIPKEVLVNYFDTLSPINPRLLKRFKANDKSSPKKDKVPSTTKYPNQGYNSSTRY